MSFAIPVTVMADQETEEAEASETEETVAGEEAAGDEDAGEESEAAPEEDAVPEASDEETEESQESEAIEETEESEEPEGAYNGITIDGNFDDWDPVVVYENVRPEVQGCAMVWDGDYLYLYMSETQSNSASWSGPNHNGNFVIRTDLDEVMLVTFSNNGAAGNNISVTIPSTHTNLTTDNGGITVAFNDEYSTWGAPTLTEIAIPTSSIPNYLNTLSFGYYLGETIIADVANLHPVQDHNSEPNDGSGIVIDGDYHDWDNYPVTTIEYDTAGTGNNYADAKGAIYSSEGTAYVYGVTNNFRDTNHWAYGNQFLEVTVSIGGRSTKMVAVLINEDGSLDWDASVQGRTYPAGTYHFALFEQSGYALTESLDDINPGDILYGDMYMTVGEYQDKTEFSFDVATVAEHLGVSAADAGSLKVQFHRIGRQELETSGISTGPVFVAVLACAAAGSYFIFTKKRKKTE